MGGDLTVCKEVERQILYPGDEGYEKAWRDDNRKGRRGRFRFAPVTTLCLVALACASGDRRDDKRVDKEILRKRKAEGRGKPSMGEAPPARRWHQEPWWNKPFAALYRRLTI